MSLDKLSGPSNRSLLLVHGRDFKPEKGVHMDLCMAALRSGVERDYPDMLTSFDAVQKSTAWYGDLNAEILASHGKCYDESLDVGDRRNVLTTLREITVRKRFGIRQYDQLPGKSALGEACADILAPVLGAIGLSAPLIRSASKDFAKYFDRKSDYAVKVRKRLMEQLCELIDRGDRIFLISHGTGGVIAYDVLWQLSHDPDLKERYADKKIELWMTLGTPLGDSNIRKRLMGAKERSTAKFPGNVIAWYNVAAEDDYICHDNTVADDFKKMMRKRVCSAVYDYHIFNLAVRYGRSNPHSSMGYFIHPRISKILVDWLRADDVQSTPKYIF